MIKGKDGMMIGHYVNSSEYAILGFVVLLLVTGN